MPAKTYSCAILGLSCELIEVEVDILGALNPSLHIVGLGDTAIQESKERIRSAFKNSGIDFPRKRKVVNLAPADLKKQGPLYDLPIAVGVLVCSKEVENENLSEIVSSSIFVGELSLDGSLKHVNGVLAIVSFAKEKGFKRVFLPEINAFEGSFVPDIEVIPVANLKDLIQHLKGEKTIPLFQKVSFENYHSKKIFDLDMKYIKGQAHAKRALEISASGAHNILFTGPPGSGKTLLARTMQTVLPNLTVEESLEVTKIYSIAGLLETENPLIYERPFRSVHHTASGVSIVGGGKSIKPGEISLAHKGILFLDEFAEFETKVLEYLRQPMEDRIVTIGRASGTISFPAHFILVASMNPCPCGFFTDPERKCVCSEYQIKRYQKKISGPILDRIDLCIDVPRLKFDKLVKDDEEESSESIKKRIEIAKKVQSKRFQGLKIMTNSEMGPREIKKFCHLKENSISLIKEAVEKLVLSTRAYFRILKVSRTIADLEDSENIEDRHLAEALQYRKKT